VCVCVCINKSFEYGVDEVHIMHAWFEVRYIPLGSKSKDQARLAIRNGRKGRIFAALLFTIYKNEKIKLYGD